MDRAFNGQAGEPASGQPAQALAIIAAELQSWLDFNAKGGNVFDDTHVMRPPVWPTRGMLKHWIAALAAPREPAQGVADAKDAARYRWIEDNVMTRGGGNGFTASFFVPHDMEDLGCAIDAALQAGEGAA